MSIRTLLDGDIASYFTDNADRPEALWVFLHIPKTAGSSFCAELASRLHPYWNIEVDYTDHSLTHNEKLQRVVDRFSKAMPEARHRFASGHVLRKHLDNIVQAWPETRFVTMLRNPVARVVSDYRYQRTPSHPPYSDFIERFPRFEDYIESIESQNKMYLHLRPTREASAQETIDDIEQRFNFVGITEMYYLATRTLFTLLGDTRGPSIYERRTEDRAENKIPNLAELTPRIREVNALDVAIYDHFHEKLKQRREAVIAYLDQVRLAAQA